jgi:hypothetical protein
MKFHKKQGDIIAITYFTAQNSQNLFEMKAENLLNAKLKSPGT